MHDYFADAWQNDQEREKLDYLFTAARLAQINRAAAQIDAGLGLSREQVDIELEKHRAEWLNRNQG